MQKMLYFCSVKSVFKILIILCGAIFLFASCNDVVCNGKRIQRTLHQQQQHAEELTDKLCHAIETNNFDSIWSYSHVDENIVFYIYHGNKMVYWSNAWLTSSTRVVNPTYDQWYFVKWDNAQGICYKTRVGEFQIVVAIPLRYNYSITSEQLRNSFIPPFKANESINLIHRQLDATYPIYSLDGHYLFSVEAGAVDSSRSDSFVIAEDVMDNFSYKYIFASGEEDDTSTNKLRTYYILIFTLIILLLIIAIYSLIRYRGFRRMRLVGKFQIVLTPTVLVILLSIFLASIEQSRKVFIETQQLRLSKKAQYAKMTLQNMYFWDLDLSSSHTPSLNIDLRDMSFAYETDIHVYDINGQLIGTSAPQLFQHGILPTHIAPQPLFLQDCPTVQYERVGNVTYLSAYTEFINGHYNQIGYIALPSFISQKELAEHIQEYILTILPLYLLLLLGAILVVWAVSRMVTSSLGVVSNQLKENQLGERGKHIEYSFSDEVGELVTHYNQMMDALAESTERLARTEREMAWRTMARQVAHEINNPLTPMKLTLQQLQRTKGTDRFEQTFDKATQLLINQIDNLSRIAKSFSAFAKMPEVKPTAVDVAAKLYDVITLMQNNAFDIPIRYIGPEKGVMAIADADQITQVFTNIVKNAFQAMQGRPDSDIIIILKSQIKNSEALTQLLQSSQTNWIEISISDNGPGIDNDAREKIFVPNFTTKNTGAGLGLPISKNIVEGSGGKITFQTSDTGTTFYIYLKKALT